MSDFTVRVVLHSANGEDYQSLHDLMEARGYSREITDNDGTIFILPDAEYNTSKDFTVEEVRNEVKEIAMQVKERCHVLVTQATSRAWYLQYKD